MKNALVCGRPKQCRPTKAAAEPRVSNAEDFCTIPKSVHKNRDFLWDLKARSGISMVTSGAGASPTGGSGVS